MINSVAICPGSFDPVTFGHLDIIERAANMFDKVIVVVADNSAKKNCFTSLERVEMIKKCIPNLKNVEVDHYSGLLADYAASHNATAIIKGLRAMSDFEYEFQMALTNRRLAPEVETLFMMPSENLAYVTASTVREIATYAGPVDPFVTSAVKKRIMRLSRKKAFKSKKERK